MPDWLKIRENCAQGYAAQSLRSPMAAESRLCREFSLQDVALNTVSSPLCKIINGVSLLLHQCPEKELSSTSWLEAMVSQPGVGSRLDYTHCCVRSAISSRNLAIFMPTKHSPFSSLNGPYFTYKTLNPCGH